MAAADLDDDCKEEVDDEEASQYHDEEEVGVRGEGGEGVREAVHDVGPRVKRDRLEVREVG